MKNIEENDKKITLCKIQKKISRMEVNTKKISNYLKEQGCKTQATDDLENIIQKNLPETVIQETQPLIEKIRCDILEKINYLLEVIDEQKESIELLFGKIDDINHTKNNIINSYNQVLNSQEKLINENKILNNLAHTDSLTGLKNPRALEKEINRLIEKYQLNGTIEGISICLLDIDDFKGINDNFGHANGDNILQNLSLLLQAYFGKDLYSVFRKGGEEFVILSKLDIDIFKQKIEKFFEILKNRPLKRDANNKIIISLSGVTVNTKNVKFPRNKQNKGELLNKHEIYETLTTILGKGLIEAKNIEGKGEIIHK